MKNSEQAIKRGKELLKRRKSKGFSRKEMSGIIGISDTAIANIENGLTENISIDLGKKIADALNVSFNELFEIEIPSTVNLKELEEDKSKLQKRIKELEEQLDDKRSIIKFLSDNDFTLSIAAKIYHVELKKVGLYQKRFDYVNWKFGVLSDKEITFTEEEKELLETPYDPSDKQSQIRYIERWFDKNFGSKEQKN